MSDLTDDDCGCGHADCPDRFAACTMCDGEGWGDCDDPLQCCSEHTEEYDSCPCRGCGGTGLRSTQRMF